MVVLYGTAQVYLCTENTSENCPTRYDAFTRKTLNIRVGPQDEKSSNLQITADSTGSIYMNARKKKFDPKKVRLGCGDLI